MGYMQMRNRMTQCQNLKAAQVGVSVPPPSQCSQTKTSGHSYDDASQFTSIGMFSPTLFAVAFKCSSDVKSCRGL